MNAQRIIRQCSACHKKNHFRKVCKQRNLKGNKKIVKTVNVDTSDSNLARESDDNEWYVGSIKIKETTHNTHAVQENTQNTLCPIPDLIDESDEEDEDSKFEDEILGDELFINPVESDSKDLSMILNVNKTEVEFKLDTGSQANINKKGVLQASGLVQVAV